VFTILDLMGLVAAVAVSLRWPGLSVPAFLLLFSVLAARRDILRRPTWVALGLIALALYVPPVLAVYLLYTGNAGWDDYLLQFFSLTPTFVPAAMIVGFQRVVQVVRFSSAGIAGIVVLSLCPLILVAGSGAVARRGIAGRIAVLIVTLAMSAFSTFVFLVTMYTPT
jgi:hypothetical protein